MVLHLQYCLDNSYITNCIDSFIVSCNVLSTVWVNGAGNITTELYMVF